MSKFEISMFFAFVGWYLYASLECFLNGGTLGRNPILATFQCYWDEFLWNIPGGAKRKGAYIKELIGASGMGCILGSRQSWHYDEIRDGNLYEECGLDCLGSPISFWAKTIIIPAIFFWLTSWVLSLF